MIVVLIAGASASGKTKLTELLLAKLKEFKTCISIKMDDYYKEIPDGIELEQYKKTTNFDNPSSLDLLLLKKHINALGEGKSIDKPIFDFKIERRTGIETIAPPAILLVDGTSSLFFAQNYLANCTTLYKIFIDVTQAALLQRRIERDILERGYADTASIIEKDTVYVGPTFFELIEPTKKSADIIVDNNKKYDNTTNSHPLTEHVEKIVEGLKEKFIPQNEFSVV